MGEKEVTIAAADSLWASTLQTVTSNVHCYGTARIRAQGGQPNYTYTIQPAAYRQTQAGYFEGLCWGEYELTATDANACTLSKKVKILEDENAPTNMFHHFSVYPNPANNVLNLKSDYLFEYEVSLLSITGQNTITQYVHDKLASIPVGNLAPGIYILRFKSDVDLYERKIVIQH